MMEEKLELNLPEKIPLDWLQGTAHYIQIYMYSVLTSATYEYFHEYFLCHLTFMYKCKFFLTCRRDNDSKYFYHQR